MVILMIGFLILRFFCVVCGICAGRNFIHQVHLMYFAKLYQSMCDVCRDAMAVHS